LVAAAPVSDAPGPFHIANVGGRTRNPADVAGFGLATFASGVVAWFFANDFSAVLLVVLMAAYVTARGA
jgi:hypothetical protein